MAVCMSGGGGVAKTRLRGSKKERKREIMGWGWLMKDTKTKRVRGTRKRDSKILWAIKKIRDKCHDESQRNNGMPRNQEVTVARRMCVQRFGRTGALQQVERRVYSDCYFSVKFDS